MAWPDNTDPIDNTEFLNDTGTVTGGSGARNELVGLIAKLNQALDSIDAGATPITTENDDAFLKQLASGLAGDIGLLSATGFLQRSGKTIATSVADDSNSVPNNKAVYDAVAAVSQSGFPKLVSLSLAASGNIQFALTSTTGMMIQWGYDSRTGTGGNGLLTTFAVPFSASPYAIVGTEDKNGTVGNSMCFSGEIATRYYAYRDNSTTGHWWIAVGPITGNF